MLAQLPVMQRKAACCLHSAGAGCSLTGVQAGTFSIDAHVKVSHSRLSTQISNDYHNARRADYTLAFSMIRLHSDGGKLTM